MNGLILRTLAIAFALSSVLAHAHHSEAYQTQEAANAAAKESETLLEYGALCADLIGEVPAFDCAEGETVPITVDGAEPETYTQGMLCDRPSMLHYEMPEGSKPVFGQCSPHSKILDLSYDDVQISAFCRRKYLRPADSPFYDEVDIVLHSVTNGATCWFHSELEHDPEGQGFDSSRVPPPTEATPPEGQVAASDYWWSPEDTATKECGSCHDADPFMYSPYIGQVWHKVPTDPFGKYFHAGNAFSEWPEPHSMNPRDNSCTGCHRIGNLYSCNQDDDKDFIRSAAGRKPIYGGNESANTFPLSHWMPVNNFHSEAFWELAYVKSVNDLLACCDDPNNQSGMCNIMAMPGNHADTETN